MTPDQAKKLEQYKKDLLKKLQQDLEAYLQNALEVEDDLLDEEMCNKTMETIEKRVQDFYTYQDEISKT